jgi:hypothetical protein
VGARGGHQLGRGGTQVGGGSWLSCGHTGWSHARGRIGSGSIGWVDRWVQVMDLWFITLGDE